MALASLLNSAMRLRASGVCNLIVAESVGTASQRDQIAGGKCDAACCAAAILAHMHRRMQCSVGELHGNGVVCSCQHAMQCTQHSFFADSALLRRLVAVNEAF